MSDKIVLTDREKNLRFAPTITFVDRLLESTSLSVDQREAAQALRRLARVGLYFKSKYAEAMNEAILALRAKNAELARAKEELASLKSSFDGLVRHVRQMEAINRLAAQKFHSEVHERQAASCENHCYGV